MQIADIAELKNEVRNKKPRRKKSRRKNILTEYLETRKNNIILFIIIILIGIFIGIFYINGIEPEKLYNLRNFTERYNLNVSSSDMLIRILRGLVIDALCLFVLFLSGVTVFAPVVCGAVCLIKGVFYGYSVGIVMNPVINSAVMFFSILNVLMFVLAAGEALGFSVFLLKNEDSFKQSISFSNITVYSVRYIVFLLLVSAFNVLETVTVPLIYSYLF